jgi:hypothetical protein
MADVANTGFCVREQVIGIQFELLKLIILFLQIELTQFIGFCEKIGHTINSKQTDRP